ncbi:ATP-dependent helicase [Bacillus toyonensis]|uniref:ATP-dependent helicase n=1 Tax=Bacillus toyonensis TaxID=155322 RepID=UPI000BFDC3B7|nr:ATP-dependent helicase [Bacillus toyonensis]PHG07397.1 DNA helicase [Bacillus toyonensis]
MDLYLKKITQIQEDRDQLAAFNSNVSTVVKAGPGSGKTTVLTLKILKLLNERIHVPRGLGCITYSKEAAKEFTSRLKKMGYQKRANVSLGTVHSFCISQIIMPYAHLFKDDFPLPIDLIADSDKYKLFLSILKDFNINPNNLKFQEMESERSHSVTGFSKVKIDKNHIAEKVAIEYEKRLKQLGKTDFIEIVKYSNQLINREEYVRKCLEAKFPWILIDEYQDFGKPLHEMVLSLINLTNIKIFAVGDPDQSIYGFNGAHPSYFLELYDSTKLLSIDLKTNYRSNQDIIDASSITLNIDDREYKAGARIEEKGIFHFIQCENELDEQYKYVVDTIIPNSQKQGIPLEEICIIVKDKYVVEGLRKVMEEKSIPYYIAKFEFSKSEIVLWLKDCAIWLVNNLSGSFTSISDFWIQLLESHLGILSENEKIKEKKKLYDTLIMSEKFNGSLNDWLIFIVARLNLHCILKQSEKFFEEAHILEKLLQFATNGEFKLYSIKQFSQIGKPENQVTISTRHSSKGLEFEVIVILGMEQKVFPDFRNLQDAEKLNEERRVFYVCITRAKRECYLLMSKNYTKNTSKGTITFRHYPSIFWNEMYQVCKKKNLSHSTS